MSKYVAIGFIIGIIVGVILYFIFPSLLFDEFTYNIVIRKALGFPDNYLSFKGGSIFAVGSLIPLLAGLFGGSIGIVYYLIRHKFLKEKFE